MSFGGKNSVHYGACNMLDFATFHTSPVGWVERSETQHFAGWQEPCRLIRLLGFTSINPTYKNNPTYETEALSDLAFQTFVLEAAQNSFVKISNLSLFNFIR